MPTCVRCEGRRPPAHRRRTGWRAGAVLFVLLSLLAASAPSVAQVQSEGFVPYAKGADWDPWVGWRSGATYNWPAIERDLDDLRRAGVTWVRTEIEYEIDAADHRPLDRLVGLLRARGISMVGKIRKNPPKTDLCTPRDGRPADPSTCSSNRRAYRAWLANVVARHGGFIRYWEAGNEPNLPQFWNIRGAAGSPEYARSVSNYTIHLGDTYRTIKAADQGIQVLIGGLSEWRAEPYLRELVRQGEAVRYFDILALHPYAGSPDAVLKRLRSMKAVLSRQPEWAAKPLWVTEVGFHAEQKGFPYPGKTRNQKVKAEYLTKTFTALRAEGLRTPIFWYNLSERATFSAGSRAGYGLQRVDRVTPLVKTNLPAYDAMRRLP